MYTYRALWASALALCLSWSTAHSWEKLDSEDGITSFVLPPSPPAIAAAAAAARGGARAVAVPVVGAAEDAFFFGRTVCSPA